MHPNAMHSVRSRAEHYSLLLPQLFSFQSNIGPSYIVVGGMERQPPVEHTLPLEGLYLNYFGCTECH